MEVRAHARNIRMSARKVRLLADLVRGHDIGTALNRIALVPRAACKPLVKVLSSAIANAQHNFQLAKNNLYVKAITVDEGTALKRWRARAYGRAAPIRKHSCSISVTLDERVSGKKSARIPTPHKGKDARKAKEFKIDSRSLPKPIEPEKITEHSDTRRMGKHRHLENVDKRELHDKKGYLKKFFNRKSG